MHGIEPSNPHDTSLQKKLFMKIQFIAAGAIAAAFVLNSPTVFGDEHNTPSRSDASSRTNQTFTGRLVGLPEYLAQGDSNDSPSTRVAERPDGTWPATPRALQANPYAQPNATRPNARFNPSNPASSHSETMVLISQNLAIQPAPATLITPTSTPGSGGRTFTGQTEPKPASDKANRADMDGTRTSGQVYVLVFGEDSSSQAALLQAKTMIADGRSQRTSSADEAGDRLPVRGSTDTDRSDRRDVSRPTQTGDSSLIGQGESSGQWTRKDSQIRVTGRVISRGGIHAIHVSNIALATSTEDSAHKNPRGNDRVEPKQNETK
jgi:hypothetical protein